MRPWLAATCWWLLAVFQLQKDAVVRCKSPTEGASLDLRASSRAASTMGYKTLKDLGIAPEVQADEGIIAGITEVDVPVVMGSRLKEPIKTIQEAAKVSWDREREGAVEDDGFPRTAEEMKRLEILFFRGHRPRILVDKGGDGIVVMSPKGAHQKAYSVRPARVRNNRDVDLTKLVQDVWVSSKDLEWCTQNGVETASDLQYISAVHIPKEGVLERFWKELQEQPSGRVSSILQEREHTHQAAAEESMQKQNKQRLWISSRRQRNATEPTTVSKDEPLRLHATAVVVDLSWSWAPLAHGRGYDVPEFMRASRKDVQTRALSTTCEANSMHGAVKVWRQLEACFQE